MTISAALVKDLRAATGAGMMDCKKALSETDGDLDAAIDWLRKKGLSAAAKKASRVASEGLVGVLSEGTVGTLVEVNSETDFVSRNDTFQQFVTTLTGLAREAESIEAMAEMAYPETGRTVAEELTHNIATIGENMSLRRMAKLSVSEGVVVSYVHNAAADGLGRIGVLVARERQILVDQAIQSGKPADIAEKMVEGRMKKFMKEVVMLEQTFVVDGETEVKKVIENAAKDAGADITMTGFARFNLGEGIEKEEADFAAEVAAQLGN